MNRGLFILGELNDADAEWLAEQGRVESIDPGLPLIQQGEQIEELHLVLRGNFIVARRGEVRDLGSIGVGEMMGEMSFLESRLPAADVRAGDERCEVLSLPTSALQERLASEPDLAARFYRGLARVLSARLRDALAESGGLDPEEVETPEPEERSVLEQGQRRLERLVARLGAAG
jgi:CRP-like cAMP-binding protein